MWKEEKLKTIQIDIEKKHCLINGEDISANCKYLNLKFEDGEWSLMITTDRFFKSPVTIKTME